MSSMPSPSFFSKDLETYSQQMQRLMTADKDMLAAIKDLRGPPHGRGQGSAPTVGMMGGTHALIRRFKKYMMYIEV